MGSNTAGVNGIMDLPMSQEEKVYALNVANAIIKSASEAVSNLPPGVRFMAMVVGVAAASHELYQSELLRTQPNRQPPTSGPSSSG